MLRNFSGLVTVSAENEMYESAFEELFQKCEQYSDVDKKPLR